MRPCLTISNIDLSRKGIYHSETTFNLSINNYTLAYYPEAYLPPICVCVCVCEVIILTIKGESKSGGEDRDVPII